MNNKRVDFSVLMTIYYKTNAEWVDQAIHSIYEQSLPAEELVIVLDGDLTEDHYNVLKNWEIKFGDKIKIIPLKGNVGLPTALNIGLKNCSFEWVARMDADDCMVTDRLLRQSEFISKNDVDILGSWVMEYDIDMINPFGVRKVPIEHGDIVKFAKWRCPMNHMSVCYKKSVILEAGGYNENMKRSQDYALWSKLIVSGSKFGNLPNELVNVRTGQDFYKKRNTVSAIKYDIRLRSYMREIGLINYPQFVVGLLFRVTIRVVPESVVKIIYSNLRF